MKVIEFFGMPRAGKTEQVERLGNYLGRQGVKYLVITDRKVEEEIKVPVVEEFDYNLVFYSKILEKLLNAKHSGNYDLVILDRGFTESEAWFNVVFSKSPAKKSHQLLAARFIKNLRKQVDLGIFLLLDPETTLERHEKKGEVGKSDDFTLKTRLRGLHAEYLKLEEKLKSKKRILIIDGRESPESIESKVRERLSQAGILKN